jgi:hypothetical protein
LLPCIAIKLVLRNRIKTGISPLEIQ